MADKQDPPPPPPPSKEVSKQEQGAQPASKNVSKQEQGAQPPSKNVSKQEPSGQPLAKDASKPDEKQQKPVKTQTASDSQGVKFSVLEMIDLALCSPEVGAVNFNILRLVLRDLVKKSGFAQTPVKVNDLEAHHVENYKNYVQGTAVASPMPGVLRIGPGQGAPGTSQKPRTPKTGLPPQGGGTGSNLNVPSSGSAGGFASDPNMDLTDKVSRMEKHLEALYQLPANSEILDKAKMGSSMSVNDMWQIIQLNNRIAAVEAAIQKMASLIEDLAKNMGKVKNDAKGLKKEAIDLTATNSDLLSQGQDLCDKCDKFDGVIRGLQGDIEDLKKGLKLDRENLEKNLGVDLGKVPSFMKPKPKKEREFEGTVQETPSEQFERGTQTFVKTDKDQPGGKGQQKQPPPKPKKSPDKYIPPAEIAEMTASEIMKEVTPDEIRTIPPEVYRNMTPEQKKAIQEIRKSSKQQPGEPRKPPIGMNKMTKSEIADLAPDRIAEEMPYDEAVNLSNEVLETLNDEQRAKVQKIIDKGPPPKRVTSRKELKEQRKQEGAGGQKQKKSMQPPPPPPLGLASMEEDEIQEVSAAQIVNEMPYEEAANLSEKILEQMTPEQQAAVKKVLNKGPPQQQQAGQKGQGKDGKGGPPPKALGVAAMTQQELQEVAPQEIAAKMGYEEAKNIPTEVLEKMTTEQQAAIKKVVAAGPPKPKAGKAGQQPEEPKMGIISMTQDQLKDVTAEEIEEKMGHEEAAAIPQKVLDKMSDKQREAVKQIINKGPPVGGKPGVGVAYMNKEKLQEVTPEEIEKKMHYQEAKNIPPKVLEKMTAEQQAAVKAIVEAGPPPEESMADMDDDFDDVFDDYDDVSYADQTPGSGAGGAGGAGGKRTSGEKASEKRGSKRGSGFTKLTPQQIEQAAQMTPEQIRKSMTPTQAAGIPESEIKKRFNAEQAKEIMKLKEQATGLSVEKAADMTASELVNSLTPDQIANLPEEQIAALAPEQQAAVKEARKSIERELTDSGYPEEGAEFTETMMDLAEGTEGTATGGSSGKQRKSFKDRKLPKRERSGKHHHHHKHRRGEEEEDIKGGKHTKVDVLKGPIPTVGEPLPPLTLEDYLANLPPEEAANLAADAVQRELQKQYQQLQGMQRQLAQDIQEKMEFIYQKLLREIVSQQLTTSPYMAVGGPEQCFGPGICTGHGMPAGIAVVQFPESKDKSMTPVGPDGEEIKFCPGPPICPGKDICPYCKVGKDGLAALKGLEKKPDTAEGQLAIGDGTGISELGDSLLQEMKSLMLLDLEKIRDEMRSKKMGNYDEQDILERLSAVWEALKILKNNEEAIAVKIAKQDALFKKLPTKTIEKLSKIPDENLEMIATGNFNKPMYIPEDHTRRHSLTKEAEDEYNMPMQPSSQGGGGADKEDIQTLFNNLANVIAECTEQKDRIDQLADTARILESGMVTKQMLLDALSDKADKGLINTKVSYDEFGNTIDELHTQLHNLMVEGYQRNENWKKVTADLAEELAEKLDKVELTPIRAFFKSHLKALEEKVRKITQLIEEPDPAGTRKKLLKDYNCISCDRAVNIAGVTNGPTLPTIGPIKAGHPTASKRALDLHRMRMRKQFEPSTKNMNALEKHGKNLSSADSKKVSNSQQIANDIDVMHVVNRYTGGSHTAIDNSSRIAAQRGSKGGGSGNAIEELFENTNRHRASASAAPSGAPPQPSGSTGTAAAGQPGGTSRMSGGGGGGGGSMAPPTDSAAAVGSNGGGDGMEAAPGGERTSLTNAGSQGKGSVGGRGSAGGNGNGSIGGRGSIGGKGSVRGSIGAAGGGGAGEQGEGGSAAGGGERTSLGGGGGGPPQRTSGGSLNASQQQPIPPVTSSVGGGAPGSNKGSKSNHGSAEAVGN